MLEGEHLIYVSVDPPALKEQGVGEAYDAKKIVIYRESPVPLHHQIKEAILRQLESGILHPGDKLPAEKELAESLGISQSPVKQAILELAREGYVQRSKGKGTFVTSPKIEETINILTSFTESMRRKGIQPETRVIDLASVSPPPEVALQLRLSDHAETPFLARWSAFYHHYVISLAVPLSQLVAGEFHWSVPVPRVGARLPGEAITR